MKRWAIVSAAMLVIACAGEATEADPSKPASYAVAMRVEPGAGDPIQRVTVPAAALVASRAPDFADVRVFDSTGRAMSAARIASGNVAQLTSHEVRTWQLRGRGTVAGDSKVEIALADGTVARVDGARATGGDAGTAAALFDTRALADPAMRLELDAALPTGQPVTFTLETSNDLKTWMPRQEAVLFRPSGSAEALGGNRIELGGAPLAGQLLRATWKVEDGDARSVSVTGARVITSRVWNGGRISVKAEGVARRDSHTVRFDNTQRLPLAAIELTAGDNYGVVPVKLYGRNDEDAAWQPLGAAILRGTNDPATIELGNTRQSQFRIVADRRTDGLSTTPGLDVTLDPVTLAVSFTGTPPYVLVAGLADAPRTALSPNELSPRLEATARELPAAVVSDAPVPRLSLAPTPDANALAPRRLALWVILLVATAGLALAVWRLARADRPPPAT